MSTIEQPKESVLIQEANFLATAPIITHTQQIAISILLRRAANELESLQKALEAAQQRIACLVEELKVCEVHVGWGDYTLENVHARARKILATEALENKQG